MKGCISEFFSELESKTDLSDFCLLVFYIYIHNFIENEYYQLRNKILMLFILFKSYCTKQIQCSGKNGGMGNHHPLYFEIIFFANSFLCTKPPLLT